MVFPDFIALSANHPESFAQAPCISRQTLNLP